MVTAEEQKLIQSYYTRVRISRSMMGAIGILLIEFIVLVMVVSALIREMLGSATIWGHAIAFLEPYKVPILSQAFGGYMTLAVVLAVVNAVTHKRNDKEAAK